MENNNSIGVTVGIGTPSIESQVMARYRQTAKQYGRYFGEQIFTVISTNPDLKWKQDVLDNKNTLRQEVRVFIIKPIDITGVELLAKDLDGQPKIVLNPKANDPNLVFPLVAPEFTKANRATVTECIERIGKAGSKPMFFSAEELPTLNELLKLHNFGVVNFYEEQSRKYMKLSETVRDMIEQGERAQIEYARQCGVDQNETEVHVQMKLEEA